MTMRRMFLAVFFAMGAIWGFGHGFSSLNGHACHDAPAATAAPAP